MCERAAIPASFQRLSANSLARRRLKNLAAGQEQEEWRVPFHRDATATSSSAPLCRLTLFFSPLALSLSFTSFFTLSIAPLRLKKGHFWSHKERDSFTPPQAEGSGAEERWRVGGMESAGRGGGTEGGGPTQCILHERTRIELPQR